MHRRREYPEYPFVGVGALIHKGGKILLIKRRFEPNKGRWSLPGGLVERGEKVEEAALREVKEELGIGVTLERLIDIANEIIPDGKGRVKYHYVLIDFLARPKVGRIRLNKESSSYRWFEPETIEKLNTSRNTRAIVRKYSRERRGFKP
ncbi:MAG: NUDIX hydrolase [Thaumarchaeota archaeon]|nr:NUDIX hydrolase [Nitrososphaerota archaeon]